MEAHSFFAELVDPLTAPRASQLPRLSSLDDAERADLATLLPHAPVDRREHLAQQLIELGESDAALDFNAVFLLLLGDAEANVRCLAIEGLWEDEDRALIEPFVAMLHGDPDQRVRAAAALALGRFVVLNEFEALRPSDAERVLAALRAVIDDSAQPPEIRARAVEAIGAASVPWVEQIIWDAYDAGDPTLQVGALHAMGRNADPIWLPTLYQEMESDDAEHRFEAAGAAGHIGDEDAVPYLAELIGDADAEVQEAAISALGQIGGDLAVETLSAHLSDADPHVSDAVRAAIAEASAELGLAGTDLPNTMSGLSVADDDDDE